MRNKCRFIFSIVLVLLLLLPTVYICFLQVSQSYIQSTRDERLKTEELVKVIVPTSKMAWEEEGKELWIGDKMFDVASYEVIDGAYHLTGVYDEDETEVAGSLLHLILSIESGRLFELLLLLQFFCFSIIIIELALQDLSRIKKIPFYTRQLLFIPRNVLAPPPR